jgi:hypothetical protein
MDTQSHLHLLHVSPDPLRQAWTVEAIGVDFPGVAEDWRRSAVERLAAIRPLAGLAEERITREVVSASRTRPSWSASNPTSTGCRRNCPEGSAAASPSRVRFNRLECCSSMTRPPVSNHHREDRRRRDYQAPRPAARDHVGGHASATGCVLRRDTEPTVEDGRFVIQLRDDEAASNAHMLLLRDGAIWFDGPVAALLQSHGPYVTTYLSGWIPALSLHVGAGVA